MSFVSRIFGGGSSSRPKATPQIQAPVVTNEADASESEGDAATRRLKRVGRAALIATSSRGVLGKATTGRRQLTAF